MQTDDSRKVSQNSHSPSAKIGRSEVLAQAEKAVGDSLEAHPKLTALQLAEVLMQEADAGLAASLAEILTREFYVHTIRAARRKVSARAQLRLPGFEHLPLTIPGTKGPVRLIEASYTRVRQYYRSLLIGHRKRTKNDPRIKEAKALMEKMRRRSLRDKRVTVGQVVLMAQTAYGV